MSSNGKLIVIEGIDGSGKATQTRLLLRRLREHGRVATSIAFPSYEKTFFGQMVARYLRGEFGPAHEVNPYLVSVLYAADRWEMRERLLRWLHDGKIVVCNRYVSANMGHQAGKIADPAARKRFLKWLERLEYGVFGLPRPDLTILLHLPCELSQSLVGKKRGRKYLRGRTRDSHEADLLHQQCAEESFLRIAATDPTWVKIDCAPKGELLPPQKIADIIWAKVIPLLSGK